MTHPLGVFDSGLGGLSVVRHLRQVLPGEDIIYFGDTARVPYGTKSRPTVLSFALEDASFLLQFDPKLMVVACNTVSSLALDVLAAHMPVPVVGVVEPAVRAAVELAGGEPIAVVGTEATIASGAYPHAIHRLAPQTQVLVRACPLLVPLVEEGRGPDDRLVRLAVEEYVGDLRGQARVLLLGCTHYPLLRPAFTAVLGEDVQVVDSGRETALAVRALLTRDHSLFPDNRGGTLRCFVSDNPGRFRRVGSRFLEHDITDVELVPPERYISSAMPDPEVA